MIPKPIRDRLGLHGNEQVEITERDGRIEIEPAPTHVELVRDGAILVARPDRAMPQLTDDVAWSDDGEPGVSLTSRSIFVEHEA